MAGKAQSLPNCRNAPNSQKVLEIRSISLFRSLSAVALAKADAFCAFLWPKICLPREIVKRLPREIAERYLTWGYLTGVKSAFKILFTPLETCFCFLMGCNPRLINDLRPYKTLYNCSETITDVMDSLQIRLFMQNKPNFRKRRMDVSPVITKEYEKRHLVDTVKTNPIQTQYKANTNPIKPKTNPIQTQNKPNFKGALTR